MSGGVVEIEERSTSKRAQKAEELDLRLFVLATHRELRSVEPLARRKKVGCRVEIVAVLPLDGSLSDGLGCVESFRWSLEQAIGLLGREVTRSLGLAEGWRSPPPGEP